MCIIPETVPEIVPEIVPKLPSNSSSSWGVFGASALPASEDNNLSLELERLLEGWCLEAEVEGLEIRSFKSFVQSR